MKDSVALTIRLQEVERILLTHTDGLSRSQIASLLGVHRSTVSRAISRLSNHLPISEAGGKIKIDRETYEASIRLTAQELLALYRRGSTNAHETEPENDHVISALSKLAIGLGPEPLSRPSIDGAKGRGSRRPRKNGKTLSYELKILFSARVAKRVREIHWHWNQRIEDDAGGGVIWYGTIGVTDDILPWIRSWGVDAIVLEPQEIRQQIVDELQRTLKLYE